MTSPAPHLPPVRPPAPGHARLARSLLAAALPLLLPLLGSASWANKAQPTRTSEPATPPPARCIDEEAFDPGRVATPPPPGSQAIGPRQGLQNLVREAISRSNSIGAQRLLSDAAESDIEEARATKRPQASLVGGLEPQLFRSAGDSGAQVQARAGVTISQTMFDGGRADRLIEWRRHQAEATRLGQLSTQEQITLSTASLALERSRYRMQASINGQYVRKMVCLVEALESIVAVDRGRTSELVQARKQLQQAELQQAQSASQARLVEAKLRRVAGDGLPGIEGLSTLMMAVPDLPQVLSAAEQSNDIAAMGANALALNQLARAVEAGARPQVSWNVSGTAALTGGGTAGHAGQVSGGVAISIPLLNPATDHSVQSARKRYMAADLQRAEVLEAKRQRIVEMHEQANAAFDRLRRVGLVLRESDRLRNFTLQQWQQLGRRSLFDVMGAESEHYGLRVQYINALHDGQQFNATLTSMGQGLHSWLQ